MKLKAILLAVLVLSVFLVGCAASQPNGYSAYNQPGQQQNNQYVGGGCGVAPGGDYENTPVNSISDSGL